MGSIKVQALVLTYVLLAVLLHPLLCQGSATSAVVEAASSDGEHAFLSSVFYICNNLLNV